MNHAATKPLISEEEKAIRAERVAYARGSVRLEGFVLSPEFEELNRRYIAGEITLKEHGDAVRRLHAQ